MKVLQLLGRGSQRGLLRQTFQRLLEPAGKALQLANCLTTAAGTAAKLAYRHVKVSERPQHVTHVLDEHGGEVEDGAVNRGRHQLLAELPNQLAGVGRRRLLWRRLSRA